jgi:CRP-like cAMP-binding protein
LFVGAHFAGPFFQVGEYKPGDFFGELSLLHGTLRDMSVMAVADPCAVWVVDRASFRGALALHHGSLREEMVQRFQAVPLLAKLKKASTRGVANKTHTHTHSHGTG